MINFFLIILLLINLYFFLDLVSPPKVKIIYPKNKEITYEDSISFKGYADKRGELFINEIPVYFDEKGYFEKKLYLKPGINRFIIKERKFWGQETKLSREIIYLPR